MLFCLALFFVLDARRMSSGWGGYSWLQIGGIAGVCAVAAALLAVSFAARRTQIVTVGIGVVLLAAFGVLRGLDALVLRLAERGVIAGRVWPPVLARNPYGADQHSRSYNRYLARPVVHRTNALGFRGGPLREGSKRILLLGDSVMYGMNLPEEATYAAVLERLLDNGYQVLNGAWPGTSTFRQEQTLVRYLYIVPSGLEAVVVGYLDNDPPDNARVASYGLHGMYLNRNLTRFDSFDLQQVLYRDYVHPLFVAWDGLSLLRAHAASALGMAGRPDSRTACLAEAAMTGPPFSKGSSEEFARGLDLTIAALRRIAAVARLTGAKTYVVYFPWGENSVHHYLKGTWTSTGYAAGYNRLKRESGAGGYVFIDGVAAVASHLAINGIDPCAMPPEYYSWAGDFTHSSPRVVEIIAGEIANALARPGPAHSGRTR